MRTIAPRALWLAAVAACGYPKPEAPADAPVVSPDGPDINPDAVVLSLPKCDPGLQTGCPAGEKCTWLVDFAAGDISLGHVGCAPAGSAAIGSACTLGPPGETGYDTCAAGAYCSIKTGLTTGKCYGICDAGSAAAPCPANYGCTFFSGVFGQVGQPVAAGLCIRSCDPIADNDFLGSGNKTATCAADEGCYGEPIGGTRTVWTCSAQYNPTRIHRAACDTTVHAGDMVACSPGVYSGYINGCAQGYEPIFEDSDGSTQIDCIAMCTPGTCYNTGTGTTAGSPNCGNTSSITTANLAGVAPHQCRIGDIQYTSLNQASLGSAGVNGEQCFFSWMFEFDSNGNFLRSPTSDTVGFCVDHSKYRYDPTGGSNNTTVWPKCDMIGLGSNGYGVQSGGADATYFGCVSSTVAGLPFTGKLSRPHLPLLRLPYSRLVHP